VVNIPDRLLAAHRDQNQDRCTYLREGRRC
jgi:hypothetical protein